MDVKSVKSAVAFIIAGVLAVRYMAGGASKSVATTQGLTAPTTRDAGLAGVGDSPDNPYISGE
jgi:hypothetical protein